MTPLRKAVGQAATPLSQEWYNQRVAELVDLANAYKKAREHNQDTTGLKERYDKAVGQIAENNRHFTEGQQAAVEVLCDTIDRVIAQIELDDLLSRLEKLAKSNVVFHSRDGDRSAYEEVRKKARGLEAYATKTQSNQLLKLDRQASGLPMIEVRGIKFPSQEDELTYTGASPDDW